MRNVDRIFNKERLMKHMVEINMYYQGHREKTEIDVIEEQKQSIILEMLWFVHYNSEIDQRTGEVKMMRGPEECEKQQRLKQ